MSSSPLPGDSAISARLGSRCGVALADVGLWVLLRDTDRLPVAPAMTKQRHIRLDRVSKKRLAIGMVSLKCKLPIA